MTCICIYIKWYYILHNVSNLISHLALYLEIVLKENWAIKRKHTWYWVSLMSHSANLLWMSTVVRTSTNLYAGQIPCPLHRVCTDNWNWKYIWKNLIPNTGYIYYVPDTVPSASVVYCLQQILSSPFTDKKIEAQSG